MRDSHDTNSVLSNNSSLKKVGSFQNTELERLTEMDTDKPLPQILKVTLKKARELLISKAIISDSVMDKERFPTYDLTDPLKSTQRELTLILIKQHEFLIHRVIALNGTIKKQNLSRFSSNGFDALKEVEAEETVSRQDSSIRELKRENNIMKKKMESFKFQVAERDEEVESQAVFID